MAGKITLGESTFNETALRKINISLISGKRDNGPVAARFTDLHL
jgi:hypothetical protein